MTDELLIYKIKLWQEEQRINFLGETPVEGAIKESITNELVQNIEDPSKKYSKYNPYVDDIQKQRRHMVRVLNTIK